MASITLTKAQRDGLCDFVAAELEADSLGHEVRGRDATAVKAIVARLPVCIGVLDQLGWNDHGRDESYRLEVDRDTLALVDELSDNVRQTILDDQVGRQDDVASLSDRRLLEHDLNALAAVRLVQAAVA